MPYSTIATGRLYPPVGENHEVDTEAAIEAIQSVEGGDPILSDKTGKVAVDELYYSDGNLCLAVPMGDWHVSLNIPLRPSDSFAKELSKMNRAFNSLTQESGYFLNYGDIEFVDRFEPDSQGRVTLGRDYANTPVKLVGSVDG